MSFNLFVFARWGEVRVLLLHHLLQSPFPSFYNKCGILKSSCNYLLLIFWLFPDILRYFSIIWPLILHSTFIICWFHIWELTYLPKFICNPKINTRRGFMIIFRPVQSGEKCESPSAHIPRYSGTMWCSVFVFHLSYRDNWRNGDSRGVVQQKTLLFSVNCRLELNPILTLLVEWPQASHITLLNCVFSLSACK